MAKTKVRVLYPSAFAAVGVDTKGEDEAEVDEAAATWLVSSGFAEVVAETKTDTKAKVKKTETAAVWLEEGRKD